MSKTTVAHRAGVSVVEPMFCSVTRIESPKVRTSPWLVTLAAAGAAPNIPATAGAPPATVTVCRRRIRVMT
ncbi:hypothetical protein [Rhodococcus sp. (in: high G+C Gram-positive bacteria)]|uniref:hypothetical protein n=1 Tax=Rhodococcus sp. TaxID=1831 RepID=UPI003B8A6164